MVEIRPFRALRYTQRAGSYESLIAQPYDKIDQDMQERYYEKSAYNCCRLTLPREKDRYKIADQRIHQWTERGILRKDVEPSIYVCRQEFTLFERDFIRTGFIAALRLHPYSDRRVLPHEGTHQEPKADRLKLLRSTMKNLEPGFLLYPDPNLVTINLMSKIAEAEPIIDVIDSFAVRHKVWRVADIDVIRQIQETVKKEQFVIADGHHRYETSLAYRDERRNSGDWTEDSAFNFRMSFLVPIEDRGLVVLPTHRLLKRTKLSEENTPKLKEAFSVVTIGHAPESIREFLNKHKAEHAFCIYDGRSAYGLILKKGRTISPFDDVSKSAEYRSLDVVILRDLLFRGILNCSELRINVDIAYVRWVDEALERVDHGEAELAFLVNPTSPKAVLGIARNLERMPEKSTDFYPKIVSGFTMMDLSPSESL